MSLGVALRTDESDASEAAETFIFLASIWLAFAGHVVLFWLNSTCFEVAPSLTTSLAVSEQPSTVSVIGQIGIGLKSAPPQWRYGAIRIAPTQWWCSSNSTTAFRVYTSGWPLCFSLPILCTCQELRGKSVFTQGNLNPPPPSLCTDGP